MAVYCERLGEHGERLLRALGVNVPMASCGLAMQGARFKHKRGKNPGAIGYFPC